ncbi:MAG: DnaB-like helicase C-terminal domain-containing protein [Bythopirellula sp.]|nr:DnaB-like helicase C-terminal domain-containing protein [Bythopirellula sp.]
MTASFVSAVDAMDRWRGDVLTGAKLPRWQLGNGFDAVELGPGLVLLLGGAPGAGKTALAMQWVIDALRIDESLRALVANVESSPAVLLDRQLSRLSGIPLDVIRKRELTDAHGERLAGAFEILDTVGERLAFLESPFSLPNVAAAADATDAKLIVIDYAQRFAAGEGEKRHEVNKLMDYLRRFADAGCGLLVLAAVGRTKDAKGRSSYVAEGLNLASFRESSELEFGADSAYMLAPGKCNAVKLACLKNRHGEPVSVELEFDGTLQRFTTADGWRDSRDDSPTFDVSELWNLPAGGDDYAE